MKTFSLHLQKETLAPTTLGHSQIQRPGKTGENDQLIFYWKNF